MHRKGRVYRKPKLKMKKRRGLGLMNGWTKKKSEEN